MAYLADPGGVFATDVHRRTLGHLPVPGDDAIDADALVERMRPDQHTDHDNAEEAGEVLADLEAAGHASQSQAAGWKMTKRGLDALNAPVGGSEEA